MQDCKCKGGSRARGIQRFTEPLLQRKARSERLPDLTSLIHIRAGTAGSGGWLGLGTGHSCFP